MDPEKEINLKNNDDSQEGHTNVNNLPVNQVHLKIYSRSSMHHKNSTKEFLKSIISCFIIKSVFSQVDDFLSQGNYPHALASHSIFSRIPALPTLLMLGLLDQMSFCLLGCFRKKTVNGKWLPICFPFSVLLFYFIVKSPFLRIHYILSNSISLPALINTPSSLKIFNQ